LSNPDNVGLDAAGNVYIGDSGNLTFNEWSVPNGVVNDFRQLNLASVANGLAVDAAGNSYFGDSGTGNIDVVSPTGNPVAVVTGGIGSSVTGLAVDGAGNLYIASGSSSILKWTAAN